jgi:hypothetical protein
MALGTVRASGGLQNQLVNDRSSSIMAEATSGLGDSVNRLAQAGVGFLDSRTDIEAVYDRRAMASKALELDTQFLQYQQDRAKEFTEYSRGRSANPGGMTKEYDAMLAEQEKAFLETVPERHREEMAAKLARDRATRVGSAFAAELELLDTADTNTLNKGLNTLGSGLKGGGVSLEDAEAQWIEMVEKSALPEITKQEFIESGKATLQGLDFGTAVEQTALGYGSARQGDDGGDVVAAGLLPQDRGVLNAIAENEAPAYNVWNGGSTFAGYEDHPAATSKAPGESTAAGRYQFILGTWRAASESYERTYGVKVPDFSPEWQDRVALHWAETQFNRHYSGATFKDILASGDPQQLLIIRDVLGKPRSDNPNDLEWKGLGHMSDAEFIEIMTGQKGFAGGGTGPAQGPNVWTDPRYANLSLEQKQSFANAAAAAAEQQKQTMANEIKLQREAMLDGVYEAGYRNDQSFVESMEKAGQWDADAQARFNSGREVFRTAESETANVGAMIAAGTPLGQDQQKAFGRWFGADSFAGIATGDEKAYAKMKYAVNQARLFPDGSVDAFRAAMGVPETQTQALAFLAAAHAGDSTLLRRSGFSQEDVAQVQLFKQLAERRGSIDTAVEDFRAATDVQATSGKTPEQLSSEASKLFSTSFPTVDEVAKRFDGWFVSEPNSKINPNTESQLMLDASTAFQDGYMRYGTEEAATAYMEAYLDKIWGTSQTVVPQTAWGPGGFVAGTQQNPVLMRHPPENHYVGADGDLGFLYSAISEYAAAGGASPYGAVLIPDEQTDREVREGKLPTYKVLGMGEFGEAIVLEGRFGGPELQSGQDAMMSEEALRKNAVSKVSANERQVLELDGKIAKAKAMGQADVVNELELEKSRFVQQRDAAKLAAQELGYLTVVPQGEADETVINNAVTMLGTAMQQDPAMSQRVTQLAKKHKGMSPDEANKLALAEVVEKEMRITPEDALKVVELYLGANE